MGEVFHEFACNIDSINGLHILEKRARRELPTSGPFDCDDFGLDMDFD